MTAKSVCANERLTNRESYKRKRLFIEQAFGESFLSLSLPFYTVIHRSQDIESSWRGLGTSSAMVASVTLVNVSTSLALGLCR